MTDTVMKSFFLTISVALFAMCRGESCDLTDVETCLNLGEDNSLSSSISLNPVRIDLLSAITKDYCGHGYELCLKRVSGNCSDRQLAPYRTIVSTIRIICSSEINFLSTCLRLQEVQHHLQYCFRLFQADIDHVIGDTALTTDEVNQGLCRSYNLAEICVDDVTKVLCNVRDRLYVDTLVRGSMQPTTMALQC